MPKVSEYLTQARSCLALAGNATNDEHRKLLQEMARTWTTLATESARLRGEPLPDQNAIAEMLRAKPIVVGLPYAPPKKPMPAPPKPAKSWQSLSKTKSLP